MILSYLIYLFRNCLPLVLLKYNTPLEFCCSVFASLLATIATSKDRTYLTLNFGMNMAAGGVAK